MSIFGPRQPVQVPGLDEICDRGGCYYLAQVRVAKQVIVDWTELDEVPHAVEVRNLDLVFCGVDFAAVEDRLGREAWQVLDDRRRR